MSGEQSRALASDADRLTWGTGSVAHLLGISREQVYELINRANEPIPSLHFGRTIRIPKAGLRSWIRRESKRRD